MLREPLLRTFRAITSAEAVGQDRPEQVTVLSASIFTPACPDLGGFAVPVVAKGFPFATAETAQLRSFRKASKFAYMDRSSPVSPYLPWIAQVEIIAVLSGPK
jgi:hypothetical protein